MPDPIFLRPVHGGHIGSTAFFRNRAFTRCLLELLNETARPEGGFRMLFHSCSVGAEPYSFLMEARASGALDRLGQLTIDATDVDEHFLEIAKAGIYDGALLSQLPADMQTYFRPGPSGGTIQIVPELARAVNFLPSASFTEFAPTQHYDVVSAMNSLAYVSPAEQLEAIVRMAGYCRHFLCVTAFSPNIIREAMDQAGFVPVLRHWKEIYYGWTNRLKWRPAKRGSQRHSWVLPRIPLFVKDRAYKVCSIFRRLGN
jgi:hypothetical protein